MVVPPFDPRADASFAHDFTTPLGPDYDGLIHAGDVLDNFDFDAFLNSGDNDDGLGGNFAFDVFAGDGGLGGNFASSPPPPPPLPPSRPLFSLDLIRAQTNRKVTISGIASADQLSKLNTQEQSPLFSKIPAELRSLIFEFVTAPDQDPAHKDDPSKTYKNTDYFYRPEHPGELVSSTNLLQTCRRIWLETSHLPLKQAENVFYFKDVERRPKWTTIKYGDDSIRLRSFLESLTYGNRQNLEHMRVFAQMYWLEQYFVGNVDILLGRLGAAPRVLTLTIRYTDWWNWEINHDLRLDTRWVQALLDSPTLPRVQELRLELETIESKMSQLRPIVEDIGRLEPLVRRTLGGGDDVRHRWVLQASPPEKTWSGPGCLGPQDPRYRQPRRRWTSRGEGTLNYRIVTLVWKSVEVEKEPAEIPAIEACGDLGDDKVRGPSVDVVEALQDPNAAFTESRQQQWAEKWRSEGSLLDFVPHS